MQDDLEQVRLSLLRVSANGTDQAGADSPTGVRAMAMNALGSVRLSVEGNVSAAQSVIDNRSQENLISKVELHS